MCSRLKLIVRHLWEQNGPLKLLELKGLAARFFETIKGESDRGCVLVAAAFLDEALERIATQRS